MLIIMVEEEEEVEEVKGRLWDDGGGKYRISYF